MPDGESLLASSSSDGFFRIAPMFYAATLFYAVSDGRTGDIAGIAATLSLFFGLTPWTLASVIVPGGWSIGAEVLFYAVFPWVARRSNALGSIAGIFILALIGDLATTKFASLMMPPAGSAESLKSAWWVWYMVASWSAAFPAGMLFYHLMHAAKAMPRPKPYRQSYLEIILVITLLYLAQRLNDGDDIVPIVLVFIPMGFCFAMGAGKWIVTRPLCWLGKISFSCYLIHFALLQPAYQLVAPLDLSARPALLCTFILATALTAICSSLTFVLIERPFIAIGESLIRLIETRSAQPVAIRD